MASSDGDDAALSIGDLADRTGVSAATLRVWETRHGFPVPHRRASGHRRYDDGHVAVVRDVVRRRDDGVRLDVAIEQALAASRGAGAGAAPGSPSVYARLRHSHPHLQRQQLRKGALLGLSWAIEDEFCAHAQRAHVFGAFQRARHFASAQARWDDLARTNTTTWVYADFADPSDDGAGPRQVFLPADHPMRREWAVVCDGDDLPVVLTAWELPGQDDVSDRDRVFETVWTVEPSAVREAARVCAHVASTAGVRGADDVVAALTGPPAVERVDPLVVTSLFNRVLAYVDRGSPVSRG